MLNNLLEAISKALYAEFKDECKIYIDEVKQGLTEPCFFIGMVETLQEQRLNTRRKFENLIAIQYFSKTKTISELLKVADTLHAILRLINIVDYQGKTHKIRGLDMQNVISDGVLVFMVQYNYHLMTPEEKICMDRLKQNGGLKND